VELTNEYKSAGNSKREFPGFVIESRGYVLYVVNTKLSFRWHHTVMFLAQNIEENRKEIANFDKQAGFTMNHHDKP